MGLSKKLGFLFFHLVALLKKWSNAKRGGLLIGAFLCLLSFCSAQEPKIVYLSWKGDPTTTMVVVWHSKEGKGPQQVFFKKEGERQWKVQRGIVEHIAQSNAAVHCAELVNLEPDTLYQFQLRTQNVWKFRTLPCNLTRPLNVVVGGDAYLCQELNTKMNREVARQSPDFVILSGDIAYTEGLRRAFKSNRWKVRRWQEFFEMWSNDMVTQEGCLIPIVPVIGNHDVREGFDKPFDQGVFFYQFFVFQERGIPFRVMKIGTDLVFYLLDSGHTFPIAGRQCEWLKSALEVEKGAKYRIPVYHVPAYPAKTSFTHRASVDIRKHWVPLFEEHGVRVVMEHDSHTFKKTFPLLKGCVNPKGIYYLGDGAWGVFPEKPRRFWYLAKTLKKNHYWQLLIDCEKIACIAKDIEGNALDAFELRCADLKNPAP